MTLPILPEFATITGIEAGATALRRVIGFGSNLVAVPLLLIINPRLVPGPLLVASWLTALAMSRFEWHQVERAEVGVMLLTRLPGSVAGAVVLGLVSTRQLSLLAGSAILVAVVAGTFRWQLAPRPPVLAAAGFASGFMSATAGVGGPPVALVYQRSKPAVIRSTIAAYSVVGTPLSLLVLVAFGHLGLGALTLTGLLVPGLILGLWLGSFAAHRLKASYTRPAVLGLCVGSATLAIGHGL